ncbi:hypothetical protein PR048_016933 [Dryococelus australis]|uniref:Uncharacterized protein n=1 Tax=Dryococelus australis TaxID=614101 RepID=A0ABQ9H8N1_9NEOP|nr:hypothetical protein PR048_016933 [Dryococelus australis]
MENHWLAVKSIYLEQRSWLHLKSVENDCFSEQVHWGYSEPEEKDSALVPAPNASIKNRKPQPRFKPRSSAAEIYVLNSPPTKANRIESQAWSPDFRKWESCLTMPLIGGFSRDLPFPPPLHFRHRTIFASITLIGSQDLVVESRPNLFTSFHFYALSNLS